MATTSRSQQISRMFKVLAKHFQPVAPVDRSVVEHLLYACCLEDSTPEMADEAFARLQELFFDWNEVRVTTVKELQEVLSRLADPEAAAARVTQALRAIFETHYDIDLEPLRKMNLGKAVEELKRHRSISPFAVNYVVQHALGGHSFPICRGTLDALYVLGIISEKEHAEGKTPGLERAVPKSKGPHMASLLHQLGVAYGRSPFSSKVRSILLEIEPTAKERLPKRETRKKGSGEATSAAKVPASTGGKKSTKGTKATPSAPRKKKTASPAKSAKSARGASPARKTASKSSKGKETKAKKRAPSSSAKSAKKTTKKSGSAARPAKKSSAKKKPADKSKSTAKRGSKSVTASLARRKPR